MEWPVSVTLLSLSPNLGFIVGFIVLVICVAFFTKVPGPGCNSHAHRRERGWGQFIMSCREDVEKRMECNRLDEQIVPVFHFWLSLLRSVGD